MEQKYQVTIDKNGIQVWRQNGKFHRPDGPAVIYADGGQEWWQNGKFHREDGPAVVFANGDQLWYQNDKLHRLDGPAIVYADGDQRWHINGEELTEEEFNRRKAPCAGREVVVDGITYCLTPK